METLLKKVMLPIASILLCGFIATGCSHLYHKKHNKHHKKHHVIESKRTDDPVVNKPTDESEPAIISRDEKGRDKPRSGEDKGKQSWEDWIRSFFKS